MTDIEFSSEITVKLVRAMATDSTVIQAAQVSSKGMNKPETVPQRLIEALMKGKHGSPFEHNSFTFFIEAPIFVFREWHRHRIASINEMSGRYTELFPKFYIPGQERKMINVGTKMKPEMKISSFTLYQDFRMGLQKSCTEAWRVYQFALQNGIANEVARMGLPLNIYSQMYWTVNARALMHFLSLRVQSEDSTVMSYPQKEIQMGAEKIEWFFRDEMPLTHAAFVKNGRVAP